jgi:hypothetical protein
MTADLTALEGGCDCRRVRYRMLGLPLFVHCCHCRWCQRESGASFALNALVEADRVVHLAGEPDLVSTPSASGAGQRIARCPVGRIALWRNYAGTGPLIRFVRIGRLDAPDRLPPDIHIFTASKQPRGRAARRLARGGRVLRPRALLARGQPGATTGAAAADRGLPGRAARRRHLGHEHCVIGRRAHPRRQPRSTNSGTYSGGTYNRSSGRPIS